jgi:hypothetical protein
MPEIKLPKLPDRTPVRITINVSPDLHAALLAYASLYRESYGEAESVQELIPYMLESFLESDRGFVKARKEQRLDSEGPAPPPGPVVRRRRTPLEPQSHSS